MNENTYQKPNTITDDESQKILLAVVAGMQPATEEELLLVFQKAIDTLHDARTDLALIGLAMDEKLTISANKDGELVYKKSTERPN